MTDARDDQQNPLEHKAAGSVSDEPIAVEVEHKRLRAAAVFDIIRREGDKELLRRFPALWWSGIAAGLSIGFSVVAKAILAAHLPEASWTPLVDSER
jgi:formate-nitrite transporter family protein